MANRLQKLFGVVEQKVTTVIVASKQARVVLIVPGDLVQVVWQTTQGEEVVWAGRVEETREDIQMALVDSVSPDGGNRDLRWFHGKELRKVA